MLVVIQSFAGYTRGDRITDAGLAATILATEDARNVITVGVPGTSAPAPVRKTLLEVLSGLANGAGKPTLIDALGDADGNPPDGYAWLMGMASTLNAGCALTDYASVTSTTQVPCQNGFITYSAFTPAFGFLSWTVLRSATNATFAVNLQTPAGLKAATPVAGLILSDTSFFFIYKGQLADNSWALFSGILNSDASTSLTASLVIPPTYDPLVVPSALAVLGEYYVFPITGCNYVFIEVATGSSGPASLLDYTTNPAPRGLVIASDANGLYVQRHGEPVIVYVAMTVSKVGGVPVADEGGNAVVMPIPGGSLVSLPGAYVPVGACKLPNGKLVFCTRAGFFEVQALVFEGTVSVSLRQTAGVHPLVGFSATTLNASTDDIRWARYDVPRGLLHLMSARNEIFVDYTTLKSLFVRKARLIASEA